MADDKKKKISLGGIDNAAEEKGSFMKTLWQLVKFLVVSGLVTIIQLALAALLPLVCDQIHTLLPRGVGLKGGLFVLIEAVDVGDQVGQQEGQHIAPSHNAIDHILRSLCRTGGEHGGCKDPSEAGAQQLVL